ncbi:MAG: hypothetical protein Tsb0013_18450 [Phycisphaerales bacterium]
MPFAVTAVLVGIGTLTIGLAASDPTDITPEDCVAIGNNPTPAEECFYGVFAGQENCCQKAKRGSKSLLDCMNCCDAQCLDDEAVELDCYALCQKANGSAKYAEMYTGHPDLQRMRVREIARHVLDGDDVDSELLIELEWFLVMGHSPSRRAMAMAIIGDAWSSDAIAEADFPLIASIFHHTITSPDIHVRAVALTQVANNGDIPLHKQTALEDLTALFDDSERIEREIRAAYPNATEDSIQERIDFHHTAILKAMETIAVQ